MNIGNVPIGLAVLLALFAPAFSNAVELKPETLKAWEEYTRAAESQMKTRLEPGHSFLWADEAPGRSSRLRRGEILVSPVAGRGWQSVPGGLIHHWIGAAFIRGAAIEDVLAVVHDYGRYKEIYQPIVVDSQVLACSPAEQQFSMLWLHKVLFVTAALRSQYESHDFQVDGRRWYNIASTVRVQEVENYGRAGERTLAPDQGDGFIWRMYGIARYAERDGGVYVELEALALTRDIPPSLRWLVSPVVSHLSRNSILTTLRQTRDAVHPHVHVASNAIACPADGFRSAALASGAGN
jgi:hypothetical protein